MLCFLLLTIISTFNLWCFTLSEQDYRIFEEAGLTCLWPQCQNIHTWQIVWVITHSRTISRKKIKDSLYLQEKGRLSIDWKILFNWNNFVSYPEIYVRCIYVIQVKCEERLYICQRPKSVCHVSWNERGERERVKKRKARIEREREREREWER